jgi:hypothetical protein
MAAEPITERERAVIRAGGSFGGAKPKALIDIAGEEWVVKFINNEPVDAPLIEHATMTLAAKAQIECGVTPGDIEQLEQQIDGDELLGLRRSFDASSYTAAPARRPRRSPFSR